MPRVILSADPIVLPSAFCLLRFWYPRSAWEPAAETLSVKELPTTQSVFPMRSHAERGNEFPLFLPSAFCLLPFPEARW
jgi:hypothetical protein